MFILLRGLFADSDGIFIPVAVAIHLNRIVEYPS